jgi:para-nitrobenzyl esterase
VRLVGKYYQILIIKRYELAVLFFLTLNFVPIMKLAWTALLPAFMPASGVPSFPSVTIDAGTVEGGRCEGQNSVFYKAIPFAEPPVKEPRFGPPKAYQQFPEGKLNATTSAQTCIQFADDFTKQELNTSALSSEHW